ncbi:phosphoribosylamine--glycine ligase [Helicobacter cholecystus]|uniref:phosphoribosylamine--glycine ligase n=1 Tax=Helicobacter cholecystus TaxID=45498 RepID=UPI002738649E|nr:phosphoribosylamine--glycine ligase [Helicobacter cholecystus]
MQRHILIIGNGGREYSLGLALSRENISLYFYPGNGATQKLGKNLSAKNFEQLYEQICKYQIDLVVVGMETPLIEGIVDFLEQKGVKVFGPSQRAAMLEGSKAYMKDFATKYNIPTARYFQSTDRQKLKDFVSTLQCPIVIKADGLCAGKGVIIAQSLQEAYEAIDEMKKFGEAGSRIVVEEFLEGYELSVFALCDGEDFVLLPVAQDHKRLNDHDDGPNTGGMGAYAPTPLCNEALMQKIISRIIAPTLRGCKSENHPFCGVLFAGIMVVRGEPILLEFNVRFGDPECEVLLPILQTPLLEILDCCVNTKLSSLQYRCNGKFALGVVLASKNYPYKSSMPVKINLKDFDPLLGHISFAGVEEKEDGLYAVGGRVCVCIGIAESLEQARENAYKICECVEFEGKQYRKDIGFKAL